jgi:hypothetical protein
MNNPDAVTTKMKSGIIGLPSQGFSDIESEQYSVHHEAHSGQLERCIDIVDRIQLPEGGTAIHGRAAKEVVEEVEEVRIENGTIGSFTDTDISTLTTEFLALPGKAVIVKSSSGTFAFQLIGQQVDGTIQRGEIDLRDFYDRKTEPEVWQAGFYNTSGEAENGVLYGNNVMEDSEFERVLEYADLNQLGLRYTYDQDDIKVTATESGYINLYQPSGYDQDEFFVYFEQEILPFVSSN